MLFAYLFADLDESRQMDSILKAVGAVKYEYGGWEIANFDTLPLSDSIPVPNGEYRVVDDYKALHLKGVWEYRDKSWRTELLMPGMASYLKSYPLDLLDWGRYLVFYIRGKGKYEMGGEIVYRGYCRSPIVRKQTLDVSWIEIRIDLDSLGKDFNVYNPPAVGMHFSLPCSYGTDRPYPLSFYIIPLADTFGDYEYEIELSPIYLVK